MGYRPHTPEQAERFKATTAKVKAAGLRRKRRTMRPTREDLERALDLLAGSLALCPHCLNWGVVKGLLCNCCDESPMGRAMNESGEYDE